MQWFAFIALFHSKTVYSFFSMCRIRVSWIPFFDSLDYFGVVFANPFPVQRNSVVSAPFLCCQRQFSESEIVSSDTKLNGKQNAEAMIHAWHSLYLPLMSLLLAAHIKIDKFLYFFLHLRFYNVSPFTVIYDKIMIT